MDRAATSVAWEKLTFQKHHISGTSALNAPNSRDNARVRDIEARVIVTKCIAIDVAIGGPLRAWPGVRTHKTEWPVVRVKLAALVRIDGRKRSLERGGAGEP
jgi:hypothetical protein